MNSTNIPLIKRLTGDLIMYLKHSAQRESTQKLQSKALMMSAQSYLQVVMHTSSLLTFILMSFRYLITLPNNSGNR